jgi:DNA-binding transcriptional MocR family regulator
VLLPLYQRLAAHYSAAIELGSLKPGERMPSVRELMARHDISLSTALQVLRFLEAQGCLEARPRVGYFVCATRTGDIPLTSEPDLSQPLSPGAHAHFVGINEHISCCSSAAVRPRSIWTSVAARRLRPCSIITI